MTQRRKSREPTEAEDRAIRVAAPSAPAPPRPSSCSSWSRRRTRPVSAGRLIDLEADRRGLVTVHPSALLRAPDEAARRRAYADFLEDLRLVAKTVPTIASAT